MLRISVSVILMTLSLASLSAQKTFKKTLSNVSGKQKVSFVVETASLDITGYNGNEVVIEVIDGYSEPPERAKGLKPLYNKATDNTGVGLEVQEAGGVMTIHQASHSSARYQIKVPASSGVSIEETSWQGGNYRIKDLNGEIEFEGHNSGIDLTNVSGPIVAKTTNGNINVVFGRINPDKPTDISATNGEVDITMTADSKVNVSISSINGEAYSDFDIQRPESDDKKKILHRRDVTGKINGGGADLTINTINGNIYLRKK